MWHRADGALDKNRSHATEASDSGITRGRSYLFGTCYRYRQMQYKHLLWQ